MRQKITFTIASSDYDFTIDDDEFYRKIEREFGGFRNNMKIISPEKLLNMYAQKSFDEYEDELIISELIERINKRLKRY